MSADTVPSGCLTPGVGSVFFPAWDGLENERGEGKGKARASLVPPSSAGKEHWEFEEITCRGLDNIAKTFACSNMEAQHHHTLLHIGILQYLLTRTYPHKQHGYPCEENIRAAYHFCLSTPTVSGESVSVFNPSLQCLLVCGRQHLQYVYTWNKLLVTQNLCLCRKNVGFK